MAYISDDTIERIREAVDMVDLVGRYVDLKASGQSYKGLCPFHSEKTPSFTVSNEYKSYKCFGCQASGDPFSFIMEMEHLDFQESVRRLADMYGIPLEMDPAQEAASRKRKRAESLLMETARFYYKNLFLNDRPVQYLRKRQLTNKVINPFLIGYADNQGNSLCRHLEEKGFQAQEMLELGLIAPSNRGTGYYDRFRDRLIFPIISKNKKVVGFGGRILSDRQPKYLNSSESFIFHKGDHLYGSHIVRANRDLQYIVLVEGYMDVVALYQHGLESAMASLGTALTKEQVAYAASFNVPIYLAYDGDRAGIQASRRAIDLFADIGLVPKLVVLPEGMDPDDYCQKYGLEAFEEQIGKALEPVRFELQLLMATYDLDQDGDGDWIDFLRQATDYLASIEELAVQELYTRQLAQELGLDGDGLLADVLARRDKALQEKREERKHRDRDWQDQSNQVAPPNYEQEPEAYYFDQSAFLTSHAGGSEDMGNNYHSQRHQLSYEILLLSLHSPKSQAELDDLAQEFLEGNFLELFLVMGRCRQEGLEIRLEDFKNIYKDPGLLSLIEDLSKDQRKFQDLDLAKSQSMTDELKTRVDLFIKNRRRLEIKEQLCLPQAEFEKSGLNKLELLQELQAIDIALKAEGRK